MSKVRSINGVALTAERLKALQALVRLGKPSPASADGHGGLWATLVTMGLARRSLGRPTLYSATDDGIALGGASDARTTPA